MIDFIKQSPPVYSKESRDYQLVSRLLTILFNFSRACSDNMNIWNNNINPNLSNLRASTLNFITKHNWPNDILNDVTSCFKYLMKNKGNLKAIAMSFNIILRSLGLESDAEAEVSDNTIIVTITEHLDQAGIIVDLLDYIIPAGIGYQIVVVKRLDRSVSKIIVSNNNTSESIDDKAVTIRDEPVSSEKSIGLLYFNKIHKNTVTNPPAEDNK